MVLKGKKGKKGGDDWDEGFGEIVDFIVQVNEEVKVVDVVVDEEEIGGGGGLMVVFRKNKEKRKKKGKQVENDFFEGEDFIVEVNGEINGDVVVDLVVKVLEEVNMDDEDVFGVFVKGKKGGKGVNKKVVEFEFVVGGDDEEEIGGGIKIKVQKEKEKKECEKQCKKE